jgi:ubiquinone/menaquinone biosynthesis C-methylase UbiE
LNLGSGESNREGFVNIDVRPVADLVAMTMALPLRGGAFNLVLMSEVLEHHTREEVSTVLQECRRVLSDGGTLQVRVPNMRILAQQILRTRDPSFQLRNIYGGHQWGHRGEWDTHHWGWTPESLDQELATYGFHVVYNDHGRNMTVTAVLNLQQPVAVESKKG